MIIEVEKILREKSIDYKLMKLSRRVVSHEDVKKYIKDINPENDCKTILTKDKEGNQFAFFLREMMKIDFSKVKKVIGKKIRILSYEELKKSTGKKPGEVCPFLLKNTKIYADKRVLKRDIIDFGSGKSNFGLQMFTKDLHKVIDFEIVDIANE
jgi:Ala-tRNA(Pro) deacylase